MPINWKRTDHSQQNNGLHYEANFAHFDAMIGVDKTNINHPIFLRFGGDTKTNVATLDDAKQLAEARMQQYIKSLTT